MWTIASFLLRASLAGAPLAVNQLPEPCRMYAALPADLEDDTFGWNQLLSLASCLQDDAVTPVTREQDVEPMVERGHDALYMPMLIYIAVLENGPPRIQLHAAYQVGMAHLMLAVRARRSVTSRALRARLEPLLARSLRIAVRSFAVVVRVADEESDLVADEVARNEVRSARLLLQQLPAPADRSGVVASSPP